MKKYIIMASIAIAASLSSCNDFLDEPARGEQNLDNFFSTQEACENYVTGCYGGIVQDDWWQVYNPWLEMEMCTENAWMGNCTQSQDDFRSLVAYMPNGQDNGPSSNFYQYRYKAIFNTNIAIKYISEANIPMSDEIRNRLVAEARFLRGYYYFELVKVYGGVPLVTKLLTPGEAEGQGRATIEETYNFIANDFRYAIKHLPQKSAQSESEMGRATRGAALGLYGKALVYQGKWKQAADTLGLLVEEGEYDLNPDYGDNFNPEYKNGMESVFEVQHMYNETYNLGCPLGVIAGNRGAGDQDGWAWGIPTAYLEHQFKLEGDNVRLRWTIIKNGDKEIAGEDDFAAIVEKQGDKNEDGSYYISNTDLKSPRIFRKYYVPLKDRGVKFDQTHCPNNWPILRYSDVLLLYAEALNELGLDAQAAPLVSKVRERVGLGEVDHLTGDELRQAIRKERNLELAGEFHHLFDIRRWIDTNGKPVVANLMGPDGKFVKWNTNEETADPDEFANQREQSDEGINFDINRDMLWPIPLIEIERSHGAIVQNPGW